jgi:hypothetical protein
MRYATWKVSFPANSTQGYTPESIIRERGGTAEGAIGANDLIIGYISDNANLANLEPYEVKEITKQQALNLAIQFNPNCSMDNDGIINFPKPSLTGVNQ